MVYIINDWAMDVTRHRLKNQQTKAVRTPNNHVLRLLQVLAEHPGETLPAYFLIQGVWQGKPVGINSLRVAIRALRMAIDDDQKPQTVILTVPGKGYQLNPDYLEIQGTPVSASAEPALPPVSLASPVTEIEPVVSSPRSLASTRPEQTRDLLPGTSWRVITGCAFLSVLCLLMVLFFLRGG